MTEFILTAWRIGSTMPQGMRYVRRRTPGKVYHLQLNSVPQALCSSRQKLDKAWGWVKGTGKLEVCKPCEREADKLLANGHTVRMVL